MSSDRECSQTAARLLAWFDELPGTPPLRVTVAYSGGVDSALVLAAAARALGPSQVLAATAVSPSLPAGMLEEAQRFADELGVRHRPVATREIELEGYTRNQHDRCYFCKATLVDALTALLEDEPAATGRVILTGTNASDVEAGWRPGIRAAAERGARTPLADTGLAKPAVRALARHWQVPVWHRPANPCLASRIAYGVPISPARLARVDLAETGVRAALREAGVASYDLRVRDLGDAVRVEVDAGAVAAAARSTAVVHAVEAAGFDTPVSVAAFASGNLNAALSPSLRHA
ncbi:MAG TPA: hypothetical protein VHO01_16585 [Jatrophihabitans sp.]|nr:hypothetical protein [Jatrophihabitans sp.]